MDIEKKKASKQLEELYQKWREGGGKPSVTVDDNKVTHKPAHDYREPRKDPFTPGPNSKPPTKIIREPKT